MVIAKKLDDLADDEDNDPIDFARLLFIGVKKLGFNEKEVGRMTLKKFSSLYKAYKDDFDLELTMKVKGIRYSDLKKEITIDDVIPY